ncbi:hypothetical protein, partial [Streptococcus infantarius]|uniref:hypothetical protein n=1 Tax=Streptococcus infantarius TaxID=102684 RepID=UPI0022E3F09E
LPTTEIIEPEKANNWLFLFIYGHKSRVVKLVEEFKESCRKLILDGITSSLRANKRPVIFTTGTYKSLF